MATNCNKNQYVCFKERLEKVISIFYKKIMTEFPGRLILNLQLS
jgi:hypothetical protein